MKLIVFSICKNEAENIGTVLDAIPKKIAGISKIEKLVVSDGSTDDTASVAKKHGALVIDDGKQKFLAYRFQEAVSEVLALGADMALNIDGDNQFNAADIPKLVEPIIKHKADFVAADRFTDPSSGKSRRPKNMPPAKYFANKIGAWIVGRMTGYKFKDVTCGFRAYSRKALIALNINNQYTYTQESFQVLAMKRMNIVSVPIGVKYYPGRKSRVVTSFLGFLTGSGINIIRSYRDFVPLRFFGTIGLVSFGIGALALIFVGQHWLRTGAFSPYKFMAFAGIYFVTLAFITWLIALMADMLRRVLNNQEKILEDIKRLKYEKRGQESDNE